MKKCVKCGSLVDAENRYCVSCGGELIEVDSQQQQNTLISNQIKQKKSRVPLLITVGTIVLVAVAAAVAFLLWFNSGEQRVKRALEAGNYEEVLGVLKSDYSLREDADVEHLLLDQLEIIKQDYVAGKKDFSKATADLDAIEKMKVKEVSGELKKCRSYLEEINNSRTHFSIAEDFFASKDYVEAINHYREVIQDDSYYSSAQDKLQQAVSLYRQSALDEADNYAKNGEYASAILVLKNALTVLPEDSQITQVIAKYEKNQSDSERQKVLNQAEQYAQSGNYAEAIATLERFLNTTPNDVEANKKLQEYRDGQKNVAKEVAFEEASRRVQSGDYPSAISLLQTFIEKYGDDAEVVKTIEDYREEYITDTLTQAEAMEQDDIVGAIGLLNEVSNNVSDSRLDLKLSEYKQIYLNNVLLQADALMGEKDFVGAVATVNEALNLFPDEQSLKDKLADIEERKPISIKYVKAVNTYRYSEQLPGIEDALGNKFDNAQFIFSLADDGLGEFYLDGKYSVITGTIATMHHLAGDRECCLKIFVDDQVVYSSDMITRKYEPVHFEIEIPAGTKFVKFVNYADEYGYSDILLVDVMLWK